jgi:hypothetical protein
MLALLKGQRSRPYNCVTPIALHMVACGAVLTLHAESFRIRAITSTAEGNSTTSFTANLTFNLNNSFGRAFISAALICTESDFQKSSAVLKSKFWHKTTQP